MAFLKGVEVIESLEGPIPVNEVASAIVAIIGTASKGATGELHLTRTRKEAEELYGTTGTLADAFDAIHDHVKSATVISINVGASGTKADVIAALPKLQQSLSKFGFFPKIIIAPGFSHEVGVGAAMVSEATKINAITFIDVPTAQTPAEAVTFKGAISSYRAMVCYPQVKVTGADGNVKSDWLSGRAAGLMVQVDKNQTDDTDQTGYWVSPSNRIVQGVVGLAKDLTYIPGDADSEMNYVNSQGILSVRNYKGSGFRLWGNRSSAFPTKSDSLTFMSWRRTMDIIEESIVHFTDQFLDKPMFTRPDDLQTTVIGQLELSVNDFIRSRIGTSLVYGDFSLPLDENPLSQLANGHVNYVLKATPPVPMERVTHRAVVYVPGLTTAFKQLVGG